MMNKYTIALPVHNGIRYIQECVTSILAQDYPGFNLEILENQSTDGTAEWLATLKDERIRIWPAKKFLSIEDNWRRILDIPKNEFLTIMAHDDTFRPNFLSLIDKLISAHPQAALYHTHFDLIDADGALIRHCWPINEVESKESFLIHRLSVAQDSVSSGYVFRSSDYQAIGGIPIYTKLLFSDDALWLSLIKNSYKATSSENGFLYRLHTQSMSGDISDKEFAIPLKKYYDFLKGFQSPFIDNILRYNWKHYVLHFLKTENIYYHWLMNRTQEKGLIRLLLALLLPGFLYLLVRKAYLKAKKYWFKLRGKNYTDF